MKPARCRLSTALLLVAAAPLAAASPSPVVELSVATAHSAVDTLTCATPRSGNACFVTRRGSGGPIADNSSTSYAFTTAAYPTGYSDCTINDVNVAVYLLHQFTGDLGIAVERNGDPKILWTGFGTCTGTNVNANFDDRAVAAANTCPATSSAYFLPNDSLASWSGLSPLASWQLDVADHAAGNTGALQDWGIALDVTCTIVPSPSGCQPSTSAVCLNNSRFKVSVTYQVPNQAQSNASANTLTPDTGWFWFFNPANVETIVKVINGCGTNNHYWVFASGLTNVKVGITVDDTRTGFTKTYTNPQGTAFRPIQDTVAFATCP
ncbi:MAG: hypothetical protein ACM3OB_02200 [Acidobacteriota bacterium]